MAETPTGAARTPRAHWAEAKYIRLWSKLAVFLRLPFLLEQHSPSLLDKKYRATSSQRVRPLPLKYESLLFGYHINSADPISHRSICTLFIFLQLLLHKKYPLYWGMRIGQSPFWLSVLPANRPDRRPNRPLSDSLI